VRWPPMYSSQASGAPEVRTVSLVIPGTTSMAGRTSTSTGSVAQIRSIVSAFARSWRVAFGSVAAAPSGEGLVISLLEQLQLLPASIDSGVEALRMLGGPDLRPDHEVVGIQVEGFAPDSDRLRGATLGV